MSLAPRTRFIAMLALAAVALTAASALANIETYTATLSGDQEVPAVVTAATGTATIIVDTETLIATFHVAFADLSSTQVGAHFHMAPAGANGSAVHAIPTGSPSDGVWNLTTTEYGWLAADQIYVNIHTQTNAAGEIRGQFSLDSTVPNGTASFSAVKALYR